ncbi:Pkinase-domain-containing protein [Delitschia confertaspora ATCC 74209]|uniref:non-specific serine/threonine protein kinase n=1 Tax=Delitschia confertaspora ATCC 74209 TaxID=1513339 RepID=A0A9P4MVI8_9PLEO|nr:Pkinase-domain-containing protein [Delitschia confertaspora ATCC 74209]
MVSHHPERERRPSRTPGHNGIPGHHGTPGRPSSRSAKAATAPPPSREGYAQRAAQDVVGLKDYQLGDCLGKGAFGSVYRALNWGTGETVAVKQIKLENLPKSELKTIMLEIDLLKNLNHPNIVKYHGFVKSTESLYIILEYCENGSLHSICKNFGKFPENLVALYMSQVLHGLLYLHEQGVIHRDIKGANILTTKEGLVKLADFGVATKASGLDESSVVGTPYWMAPEVIELSGATTSSDIWSLGCTVIELIEGKPPYHKLQPMQALFRIVNDEHPPIPGSASPAVRDFLMQCFQKNPNLRISAKRLLKHPWILSAKRTVSVVPTKPTEYDEAVKSVQKWNEALKSTSNNSLRRSARLAPSLGESPPKKGMPPLAPLPERRPSPIDLPKPKATPDLFRSPEADSGDNWDADFDSSISPSALRLPHLRPHDNFAGLFSSEKLKAYASFESVTEEPSQIDDISDVTVRSPLHVPKLHVENFDGPETVRPPTSSGKRSPSKSRPQLDPSSHHQDNFEPKTAFLRGVAQSTQLPKHKVAALARPSALFRENTVEDYSDLLPADEGAFEKKLKAMQVTQPGSLLIPPGTDPNKAHTTDSFSPKLFHPSDLKTAPRSSHYDSSGQRSSSSTSMRKMQRSQSEIEIQKYAEDDKEDFSDILGHDGFKAESDSGSEHSLAVINPKAFQSFISNDDDEADAFADLEEGVADINLESNVARDRDDRLTKQTENLVGCLKTSQPNDVLLDIVDQLIQVLYEAPEKKSVVLRSHGMLPILEILANTPPREIVLRLLKIVNMIILEDAQAQESLSFLGGIPVISNFAHKKYSSEIRKEAAAFVRQMYQTSTLTLQMFIGCGGINVLVEFLEEDIDTERDLVLIGVNGVWSVFELQGPTPKNDFCRIFSRSSVLYPLSLVLSRVVDETDELAELIEGRIVNIFLIFSQAEVHVKELVADRMILKRVLKDLRKMSPPHQITMLKFIKNLSTLSATHEALQNSNAIDVLIELLKESRKQPLHVDISNQILTTMFNLCHHNRSRQEEAALSDIIPILKEIVLTARPLKEFALPLLCELAHSGKIARMKLWENRGLQFYISILKEHNWMVSALDAIFIWLQEETARVEHHLLNSDFSAAIIRAYTDSVLSQSTFQNFLEPLQKLVRLSIPIAASLAVPEIFTRSVSKLRSKDASARLNLLRILRTICEATEEGCTLLKRFGVHDSIFHLSEREPAILVRKMAEELIRDCDEGMRSSSRAQGYRRPATSGASRAGSGSSSNGSMGHTTGVAAMMMPPTPPTPTLMHSFNMPSTPKQREHIGRSRSSANIYDIEREKGYRGGGGLENTPNSGVQLVRSSTTLGITTITNLREQRTPGSGSGSGYRPASQASMDSIGRSSLGPVPEKAKSRLPKAKSTRASLASIAHRRERSGNATPGGDNSENTTPTLTPTPTATPSVPRLAIRRRRETSGGEMGGRPRKNVLS